MNNPRSFKLLAGILVVLCMGLLALFAVARKQSDLQLETIHDLKKTTAQKEQINIVFSVKTEHQQEVIEFITRKNTQRISFKNFDLYYDDLKKQGFLLGPDIEKKSINFQYQLWIKNSGSCLSAGLFTYDEFLSGSDVFDLNFKSGDEILLTIEKMGGAKLPTLNYLVEKKLIKP